MEVFFQKILGESWYLHVVLIYICLLLSKLKNYVSFEVGVYVFIYLFINQLVKLRLKPYLESLLES